MRSIWDFVIKPLGSRYTNTKELSDGKELIINSEISNHQFINREAEVLEVPIAYNGDIKKGDTVIVHHNVFRRWLNVKGEEKNSRAFLGNDKYLAQDDQVYLYKRNEDWQCPRGYCFVQPIKDKSLLSTVVEKRLMGIVKYSDGTVDVDDLIGFKPNSEFEFVVDNQRMYRVKSNFITIKYEYQGDEEEYNTSWA